MAEPSKSGGGGGAVGGGAGGMIFFMFILAIALYVVATQQISIGMPGGGSINIGNWLSSGSSNGQGINRTDVPAGFTAAQLSPLFKKIRIVSLTPAHGAEPAVIGLAAAPDVGARALTKWKFQSKAGTYLIGPEGATGQSWRIPLASLVLNTAHDRLRLFDEQGLLVEEYTY